MRCTYSKLRISTHTSYQTSLLVCDVSTTPKPSKVVCIRLSLVLSRSHSYWLWVCQLPRNDIVLALNSIQVWKHAATPAFLPHKNQFGNG